MKPIPDYIKPILQEIYSIIKELEKDGLEYEELYTKIHSNHNITIEISEPVDKKENNLQRFVDVLNEKHNDKLEVELKIWGSRKRIQILSKPSYTTDCMIYDIYEKHSQRKQNMKTENLKIKNNCIFAIIHQIYISEEMFYHPCNETLFGDFEISDSDRNDVGGIYFGGWEHGIVSRMSPKEIQDNKLLKLLTMEHLKECETISVHTGIDSNEYYEYEYITKIGDIKNDMIYEYKDKFYKVISYDSKTCEIKLKEVTIIITDK